MVPCNIIKYLLLAPSSGYTFSNLTSFLPLRLFLARFYFLSPSFIDHYQKEKNCFFLRCVDAASGANPLLRLMKKKMRTKSLKRLKRNSTGSLTDPQPQWLRVVSRYCLSAFWPSFFGSPTGELALVASALTTIRLLDREWRSSSSRLLDREWWSLRSC